MVPPVASIQVSQRKFFEMRFLCLFDFLVTHIPLVNVIRIPRLVLFICRRHVGGPAMQLGWREEWKSESPNNFFSPPAAYPIGNVSGLINKA